MDTSQFVVSFLGVRTRRLFCPKSQKPPAGAAPGQESVVETEWPRVSEGYFEWIDLLEAVSEAEQVFTMIELGAGYGKWLVNAAAALRRHGHNNFPLIGVEAEPTHFQWMKLHFTDNGLEPEQHRLVEAAAAKDRKGAWFAVGQAETWYGQAVVATFDSGPQTKRVATITLDSILDCCDRVDLLDLDIQGLEYDVLAAARKNLHRKVKRVHIGTHNSEVEQGLRRLFFGLGWTSLHDFGCGTTVETLHGNVSFRDGVRTWLNPFASSNRPEQSWSFRPTRRLVRLFGKRVRNAA